MFERIKPWVHANHRELAVDVLRIFLGIALFVKGVMFIRHASTLLSAIEEANFAWGAIMIAHYVVLAHIGGGLLLTVGLLTRVAAAVQLPVLLGASVFVHGSAGLFTPAQTLEFTILVSLLLTLFAVMQPTRLSVDYYVRDDDDDQAPISSERPAVGRVEPVIYPSPAE